MMDFQISMIFHSLFIIGFMPHVIVSGNNNNPRSNSTQSSNTQSQLSPSFSLHSTDIVQASFNPLQMSVTDFATNSTLTATATETSYFRVYNTSSSNRGLSQGGIYSTTVRDLQGSSEMINNNVTNFSSQMFVYSNTISSILVSSSFESTSAVRNRYHPTPLTGLETSVSSLYSVQYPSKVFVLKPSGSIIKSQNIISFSKYFSTSIPISLTPSFDSTLASSFHSHTPSDVIIVRNLSTTDGFSVTTLIPSATLMQSSSTKSQPVSSSPSTFTSSTASLASTQNNSFIPPAFQYSTLVPGTNCANVVSTTQSGALVIRPPHLAAIIGLKTTTPSSQRCPVIGCCTYGLSQLPASLHFEESKLPGYILASMHSITNATFSVQVVRPAKLVPLLDGVFNITESSQGHDLVLLRKIDLEDLYIKVGEDTDVQNFQLLVGCTEGENNGIMVPPRLLNVTVDDVDDNMPEFDHSGPDSGGCLVPVYSADAAEDYVGELALSPGQIRATDGDFSARHNITYRVMHSEPEDYHVYFKVDSDNGTVHKRKAMNSSDPSKYVIFVQAVEDSPQQKSRVAILSIVVVAPSDPYVDPYKPDPNVKLALQIVCAFVLMAFICGFVVIFHHRYRKSKIKTEPVADEFRDMKIKVAVYQSSNSSLNSTIPDIPTISSPSQVVMSTNSLQPPASDFRTSSSQSRTSPSQNRISTSQKTSRKVIVKKPLDTKARPGWNAPAPKPKPSRYNPFDVYKKAKSK